MSWAEVATVREQKRHELVLGGSEVSGRIERCDGGLHPDVYTLSSLNYLCVSETSLRSVTGALSQLSNLTSLVLHSNKLTELPDAVGLLDKLKLLDVSRNALQRLPEAVGRLPVLAQLNVSMNQLQQLPGFVGCLKLAQLDASQNQLSEFPDVVHPAELLHLAEIKLKANQIGVIPWNVANLPSLKLLDLTENLVELVPGELADNSKLKDIMLKGNKLADKRLMKMVDQCKPKQIVDYIRQNCPKGNPDSGGAGAGKKGKKGKGKQTEPNTSSLVSELCDKINVLHVSDDTLKVISEDETVQLVRPHIVCCILRDVTFTDESLRSFIHLQTRLHDGLCQKRQLATIATHDLALLPEGPLHYLARPPKRIKLVPLAQDKQISATELFQKLQAEAKEEKKEQSTSGIFRFLTLLEGKQVYPFVKTSAGVTISLPPITNSEVSKISASTKDILVEITSSSSQGACKSVLQQLLLDTLELDIVESRDGHKFMTVQQVKVVDTEGTLKLVYPSRADLQLPETEKIVIVRE